MELERQMTLKFFEPLNTGLFLRDVDLSTTSVDTFFFSFLSSTENSKANSNCYG